MSIALPAGWNNPRVDYVDQHKSDAYRCCHCKETLYQPRQASCGHRFCSPCLDSLLVTSSSDVPCPGRDNDDDEGCDTINKYNTFPDFATFRDMCKMKVYCPNREHGCDTTCKFLELQSHLENCSHRKMPCPIQGCEYKGASTEMDEHMEKAAVSHTMLLAQATSKQQSEIQLLREDNRKLARELQEEKVLFQTEKKKLEDSNKELEQRLQEVNTKLDDVRQLSSTSSGTDEGLATQIAAIRLKQATQEEEYKKLHTLVLSNNARLTGYNVKGVGNTVYRTVFEWHITDYKRRKEAEIKGTCQYQDSPPFYCNLYKMCARLYINGDGMGRGTHLSLYLSLLKGDHDDELSWPFQYRICMVLLNQRNPNHKIVQEQFDPVPTSQSYAKPTARNKGTGFPLFATHHLAESEQSLVDDSIKILVQVDTLAFQSQVPRTNSATPNP